jgi:hypothetical protein
MTRINEDPLAGIASGSEVLKKYSLPGDIKKNMSPKVLKAVNNYLSDEYDIDLNYPGFEEVSGNDLRKIAWTKPKTDTDILVLVPSDCEPVICVVCDLVDQKNVVFNEEKGRVYSEELPKNHARSDIEYYADRTEPKKNARRFRE